jgi:prepilin-type N-terminal cleavage/methylation domain-containing protein
VRTIVHRDAAHADRPAGREAGFTLVELLVTMVVVLAVLAVVTQIVVRSNVVYAQQRAHLERRYSTATTVEMIARLLRQAQSIETDPDGNGALDSVRIVADWNPRDGDTADAYEDIVFSQTGLTLFKREPADAAPVPFAENVNQLSFVYFNPGGGPVLNPLTVTIDQLAFVTVRVATSPVDGQPGLALASSASVRRLE